jgi:hypothetical protein
MSWEGLTLIAAGYAVAGGYAAVAVNEFFMPADIAQGSPGMVAFGDMILLVLVAGFLSLVPTWFVLKASVEKAPRALLAAVLLIAGLGPASWLTVVYMVSAGPPPNVPQAGGQLFGIFIAFAAIPRMVAGPVLLVIEAVTFLLARGHVYTRAARRGDADGSRPAQHVRAAYGKRASLLDGASEVGQHSLSRYTHRVAISIRAKEESRIDRERCLLCERLAAGLGRVGDVVQEWVLARRLV